MLAPWLGGILLFRALTGYCPLYGALGTGARQTGTDIRVERVPVPLILAPGDAIVRVTSMTP